ncbi:MAG: hydroxyacid dehydrogenase [Actinobacteria bacterium]|nr:hydroxyacid dehydrogenase [Actinomycetota bacterium]
MSDRTIVISIETPLLRTIANEAAERKLRALGRVVVNESDARWSKAELIAHLSPEVHALITSWGTAVIDADVLAAAPRLEVIGHAAGSIKRIYERVVWERGVKVTQANHVIAESVAEFTLGLILAALRRITTYNRRVQVAGPWRDEFPSQWGRSLYGKQVGIVGASQVGRRVVPLVRPFTSSIVVYDPFLPTASARELGVRPVALDDLMTGSDVVTLHAPILPETKHMIGAKQLVAMKEGALLVNTARSWLVDQQALLDVLVSGRISAALDVFDQEPLPDDSPFRALPNVILTPHVAGRTVESMARQVEAIADELTLHFSGQPMQHEIRLADLDRVA